MLNFSVSSLTVDDIAEINNNDTLHIVDFRATGESLQHEIASMFIYENLSQWIPSMCDAKNRGMYAVNTRSLQRDDLDGSILIAEPGAKMSQSVISRIANIPERIKKIWVAVPHPDYDRYSSENDLSINYTYDDFLRFNNKLTQKKLLQDFTPDYFDIINTKDLQRALEMRSGFVKSSLGAGGFSVLDVKKAAENIKRLEDEIVLGDTRWYYESMAKGTPYSVQIYKKDNSYILFGYAEQYVEGTNYFGAKLLDIKAIGSQLHDLVNEACKKVHPLIKDYTGFFGIDMMIDTDTISILELNMRLTANTIPTLLANATDSHEFAEYFEEVPRESAKQNDIAIANSLDGHEICILRIFDKHEGEVGKIAYIQITG